MMIKFMSFHLFSKCRLVNHSTFVGQLITAKLNCSTFLFIVGIFGSILLDAKC